jgi:pyruvate kinase
MKKFAKIVATIGPVSRDEKTLTALIQAGMNVARMNFSHGSYKEHADTYKLLRAISRRLNKPITILQDLQGPKIRTGEISGGMVELLPGKSLILTTKDMLGDQEKISVDYPGLIDYMQVGTRILLDDGNLELQVEKIRGDQAHTIVVQGGILKPNKGVNLPGVKLDIPGFTEKDQQDLALGMELGVDMVAISFVRGAEDITVVRKATEELCPDRPKIPLIAKLERPEALDNLESIIRVADGVMVARGDLGVEMEPQIVPIAQKQIIEMANRHALVVITATQMLDSMIHNPRPTRAEASDVANAIFDGTDAVMLSGETAVGSYAVRSVEMMEAIICKAEKHLQKWGRWQGDMIAPDESLDDTYYTVKAACELAHDRNVSALATFTQSGRTARLLSKARPNVPILAFTPNMHTYQRLNLYWGVTPHLVPRADSIPEMLNAVESVLLCTEEFKKGQQVVLICGYPLSAARPTNLALLHTVGEDY